jgi:hypothetical protein
MAGQYEIYDIKLVTIFFRRTSGTQQFQNPVGSKYDFYNRENSLEAYGSNILIKFLFPINVFI